MCYSMMVPYSNIKQLTSFISYVIGFFFFFTRDDLVCLNFLFYNNLGIRKAV